jgi:hypothetical protein
MSSFLPLETNESLRDEYVYSVQQFHSALSKMYGFFGFLQPEVVFHQFRNFPPQEEMNRLTEEVRNNLNFGKTYVGAKLLAMSLVAALAVLTGGDEAPLSLFTGDLRSEERRASTITASPSMASLNSIASYSRALPLPRQETLKKCTLLVYEILAIGRRTEMTFDIKRSPWAAYLYGSLGNDELFRILGGHTLYPMSQDRAWELLRDLPRDTIFEIAEDMAETALSRAELIRGVIAKLYDEG